MSLAFFDLDKTLLASNSATLWVRAELRAGFISRWQALRAGLWLLRYSLGGVDFQDALRQSVASLAGSAEADLASRAKSFYEREVRRTFRPGAASALERHRTLGDRLVILSSTSPYVCGPAARDLGVDDFVCSRFEVDAGGRFTGRAVEPLCFGPGKLLLARGYAVERGVELSACAFYSDSASDIPVLEAVGRPVAVNPDPRLRRVARARGWEIADWGEPARV